jgi:hypothetical protein
MTMRRAGSGSTGAITDLIYRYSDGVTQAVLGVVGHGYGLRCAQQHHDLVIRNQFGRSGAVRWVSTSPVTQPVPMYMGTYSRCVNFHSPSSLTRSSK